MVLRLRDAGSAVDRERAGAQLRRQSAVAGCARTDSHRARRRYAGGGKKSVCC